jgi:thiamine-phosphate pyrophosphorylase
MPKYISNFHYLTHDLEDRSHAMQANIALESGVSWVQFRTKVLKGHELISEALKVRKLCNDFNAKFIINDYVEVAKEVNADGVHLGKEDMEIAKAREILGDDFIVGATVNSKKDLVRFALENVDYLGVGPYRNTSTKKNLSAVLAREELVELIREIRSKSSTIPIILIGGINVSDILNIMELGANGVAVSSTINMADNPSLMTKQILNTINEARYE